MKTNRLLLLPCLGLLASSSLLGQNSFNDAESYNAENCIISPMMMFRGDEEDATASPSDLRTTGRGIDKTGTATASQVARGAAAAFSEEDDTNRYLENEIDNNIYTAALARVAEMSLDRTLIANGSIAENTRVEWEAAKEKATSDVGKSERDLANARRDTKMIPVSNSRGRQLSVFAEKITEAKLETANATLHAIRVKKSSLSRAAEIALFEAQKAEQEACDAYATAKETLPVLIQASESRRTATPLDKSIKQDQRGNGVQINAGDAAKLEVHNHYYGETPKGEKNSSRPEVARETLPFLKTPASPEDKKVTAVRRNIATAEESLNAAEIAPKIVLKKEEIEKNATEEKPKEVKKFAPGRQYNLKTGLRAVVGAALFSLITPPILRTVNPSLHEKLLLPWCGNLQHYPAASLWMGCENWNNITPIEEGTAKKGAGIELVEQTRDNWNKVSETMSQEKNSRWRKAAEDPEIAPEGEKQTVHAYHAYQIGTGQQLEKKIQDSHAKLEAAWSDLNQAKEESLTSHKEAKAAFATVAAPLWDKATQELNIVTTKFAQIETACQGELDEFSTSSKDACIKKCNDNKEDWNTEIRKQQRSIHSKQSYEVRTLRASFVKAVNEFTSAPSAVTVKAAQQSLSKLKSALVSVKDPSVVGHVNDAYNKLNEAVDKANQCIDLSSRSYFYDGVIKSGWAIIPIGVSSLIGGGIITVFYPDRLSNAPGRRDYSAALKGAEALREYNDRNGRILLGCIGAGLIKGGYDFFSTVASNSDATKTAASEIANIVEKIPQGTTWKAAGIWAQEMADEIAEFTELVKNEVAVARNGYLAPY